jgi:hypothetical protein
MRVSGGKNSLQKPKAVYVKLTEEKYLHGLPGKLSAKP